MEKGETSGSQRKCVVYGTLFYLWPSRWGQWNGFNGKKSEWQRVTSHGGFEVPVWLKCIIPRRTIQLCKYSALRTCGQGTKSFGRVYFPMLVWKLDYLRSPSNPDGTFSYKKICGQSCAGNISEHLWNWQRILLLNENRSICESHLQMHVTYAASMYCTHIHTWQILLNTFSWTFSYLMLL